MKVAKASEQDLDSTSAFLNAAEAVLEREKFSFNEPEENYAQWNHDDEDKKLILKIKENLEFNENACNIDNRILMYEFLKIKFKQCSTGWRRVHIAAELLIPEVTDPTESHLAFYPGFELFHVAPEQ